jgi:hypothetical protein
MSVKLRHARALRAPISSVGPGAWCALRLLQRPAGAYGAYIAVAGLLRQQGPAAAVQADGPAGPEAVAGQLLAQGPGAAGGTDSAHALPANARGLHGLRRGRLLAGRLWRHAGARADRPFGAASAACEWAAWLLETLQIAWQSLSRSQAICMQACCKEMSDTLHYITKL